MSTVELLKITYDSLESKMSGVYFGRIGNEMQSLFHMAYWLTKDYTEQEVHDMIFKLAPFKLGINTTSDLELIVSTAIKLYKNDNR